MQEEGGGEPAVYLAVADVRGLVYLVQLGVLELHAWNARRDRLDRPDRMIFDLDPDPALPFTAVVDREGRIRHRILGRFDNADLRAAIAATL